MGEIASRLSNHLVVTSDNPRDEDPYTIIEQIRLGCDGAKTLKVLADRRQAIDFAICSAESGDSVLIAGKGHEEYQEVMGKKYPFSDKSEVHRSLQARLG